MSNKECISDGQYLAIAVLPNGKKIQLQFSDGSPIKNKPDRLITILSGKKADVYKPLKPVVDNGINYVPDINEYGVPVQKECVEEGMMFKTSKMNFKFVQQTSKNPTSPSGVFPAPLAPPAQSQYQMAAGRRRKTRRHSKRMKTRRHKTRRKRRNTRKH